MYSSFLSLGKFIPIYFVVVVVAMVNGIDSLISLSDKEVVVHIHNGILLGHKEECI